MTDEIQALLAAVSSIIFVFLVPLAIIALFCFSISRPWLYFKDFVRIFEGKVEKPVRQMFGSLVFSVALCAIYFYGLTIIGR